MPMSTVSPFRRSEGRTSMAALVTEDQFNLAEFHQPLMSHLPPYAGGAFVSAHSKRTWTLPEPLNTPRPTW